MNIILCGCGDIGRYVLSNLLEEDHQNLRLIIESDPILAKEIKDSFDVLVLNDSGLSMSTIKLASTVGTELFVATMGNDAENIVACLLAKKAGVEKLIARVSSNLVFQDNEGLHEDFLGIDLALSPEGLTAQEINRLVRSHGALSIDQFAGGEIEATRIQISTHSSWIGYSIQDLKLPTSVIIAAVVEQDELHVARGGLMIRPNSEVILVGLSASVRKIAAEQAPISQGKRDKIFFSGLSQSTEIALEILQDIHHKIQVIEKSRAKCEELAAKCPEIAVIHGDGTDYRKLQEEDIDLCSTFIAGSKDDSFNLTTSLLAQQEGVNHLIPLVHNVNRVSLFEQLDIPRYVSPSLLTGEAIMRFIRGNQYKSVSVLENGAAEIFEIVIKSDAPITQKPLKDVIVPVGSLIVGVKRNKLIFVPHGNDTLKKNDQVVAMTTPRAKKGLNRLLGL